MAELPLAWFGASGGDIWSWSGKWNWSSAPHQSLPSLYVQDFFLEEKRPWFTAESVNWLKLDALQGSNSHFPSVEWTPQKAAFETQFKLLKKLFEKDSLSKGVPYTDFVSDLPFSNELLEHFLGSIGRIPQGHYLFGLTLPGDEIVGATPEILFNIEGEHVQTMALAGTSLTHEFSFKDQKEHQLVVEDLENRLSLFGDVNFGPLTVKESGPLKHLMTPIEVKLQREIDFEQLVQLLHPTPALGIYPRNDAGKNWLKECDKTLPRKRYGAPLGLWYPEEQRGICLVAIRHFQWIGRKAHVFSGCGVVNESIFENEWEEINNKFKSVLKMWGIDDEQLGHR